MRKTDVKIDLEALATSAGVLRALAHPLRMKILQFIDKYQTINVNKVYNTLKLEQSITSQHLRILRQAGIVITKREGKFIHYSIDYDRTGAVIDRVNEFLKK